MSVEEEFKNFVNGDTEEQTNNDKRQANGATRNSTEEAQNIMKNEQKREDSTQMSAEELVEAVTGDPWEWYCNELERELGKERAQEWLNRTDEEFESPINRNQRGDMGFFSY